MQPTIGDRVLYKFADFDATYINNRRKESGEQGNHTAEGDVYPATIVRCFGGPQVNLQVHLDGVDTHWATSRAEGDGNGQWAWPQRVEA